MIYTNDEADKATRQRNYYLSVYLLPLGLVAVLCGLVYGASAKHYLPTTDTIYGYFLTLLPAFLLSAFNRRHWLKMPDGTFHQIKGIAPNPKQTYYEPAAYEAEYVFSKKEKAITTATGLALLGLGSWLGVHYTTSVLMPIMAGAIGLFLTYSGIKGLFDKNAKLKVAKNGLWTAKLGFVSWDDVNFAEVVEDKSGRTTQLLLEIRLKGTKFEEANVPDERLLLSDLKDKELVEAVITNSIIHYNQQKKQGNSQQPVE
jgi:hypothetical protein